MTPDDLRVAAFIVLAIAFAAVTAYAMWATHQLDRHRNEREPVPPEWVNHPTPAPRPCGRPHRRGDYREDCTA